AADADRIAEIGRRLAVAGRNHHTWFVNQPWRFALTLLAVSISCVVTSPWLSSQSVTTGKASTSNSATEKPALVFYPDPDIGVATLATRRQKQLATTNQFQVFYQFQFTDKLKESGITFVHHIVDDAGKTYKQA